MWSPFIIQKSCIGNSFDCNYRTLLYRGLGFGCESGVASKHIRGSRTTLRLKLGSVAARTFAARPLLAVLFWSTIRFLVVGRRGQVGAGSARGSSQSTSARRAARAPRSFQYTQIWKWQLSPRQVRGRGIRARVLFVSALVLRPPQRPRLTGKSFPH